MKLKFETSNWLFTQYDQGLEMLIIDCRPFCEYSQGHIEGAINISVPSLMLRRLKKGNVPLTNFVNSEIAKTKFTERSRYDKVIVYDESSKLHDNLEDNLLGFLHNKLATDCNLVILDGGFASFEVSFPHLCQCGEETELGSAVFSLANLNLTSEVPSPILRDTNNNNSNTKFEAFNSKELLFRPDSSGPICIVPQLYLGNKTDSSTLQLLRNAKITHILNVTHDLPNYFADSDEFKYLKLPVQDNWSGNVMAMFPLAFAFIDKALSSGGRCLVHCVGGISRSSTIIIGYLMLKNPTYTLNDAYDHVKSKKTNIAPNFNFMGQLLDLEKNKHLGVSPTGDDDICTSPGSVSPVGSDVSTSSQDTIGSC